MPIDRPRTPTIADERTSLLAWLDFHRATLLTKADGLSQEQLAHQLAPSTLTLAGLVKHMALVESSWLSRVFRGEPLIDPFEDVDWKADYDWDFHSAVHDTPEELFALFARSTAASDEILAAALAEGGFDQVSATDRHGRRYDLRWILTHLIEEYARHNGHADLIRESIDGVVGE